MGTNSTEVLLKHADMDAIVLMGLGYATSRARGWIESSVLPPVPCREPARKMIAGEMELLDLIVEQIKSFNKPIIPVIDIAGFDDPGEGNIVQHLDRKGVMAYSSPEQAIRALAKAQQYYRKRKARAGGREM